MEPGEMIRQAREAAGLSKRELAQHANTSPAALVEYESGRRDPNARTLLRIIAAAGGSLELVPTQGSPAQDRSASAVSGTDGPARPPATDDTRRGEILFEVLRLAEHLPQRPSARRLPYPKFPS